MKASSSTNGQVVLIIPLLWVLMLTERSSCQNYSNRRGSTKQSFYVQEAAYLRSIVNGPVLVFSADGSAMFDPVVCIQKRQCIPWESHWYKLSATKVFVCLGNVVDNGIGFFQKYQDTLHEWELKRAWTEWKMKKYSNEMKDRNVGASALNFAFSRPSLILCHQSKLRGSIVLEDSQVA